MAALAQPAPGITPVDTLMAGRAGLTCAYLIDANEPALIETGPATSAASLAEALQGAGLAPDHLAHVVLTHIHLDHAGGAGHLARRFPRATFWIHEQVAPHLADPARLVRSAARVYGAERLDALFGQPLPLEPGRIRGLAGGERLSLGNRSLAAIHTPGHASGHLALQDLDSDVVMTGDAVGVHLPDADVGRPAAPPPEFDLDAALDSIATIRQRARGSLLFAHFGPTGAVERVCDEAAERLRAWAEAARRAYEDDPALASVRAALETLARETEGHLDPGIAERFETIGSVAVNAMGLERYWRKRAEDHASS